MDTLNSDGLSALIADDHPSIRYGIRSILEDAPFITTIDEADSGERVLELLEGKIYHIILMDISMPNGDGISTTEKITKLYPHSKVIALSMYKEERYVVEMFKNGAMGYLLKNADRDDIIEAITEVNAGNKYVSLEISQSIIKNTFTLDSVNSGRSKHGEVLREIIYLLCFEMTSKEIGDILCLSNRTIEKYRQHINKLIGSKNLAGVLLYAQENDIYYDMILENKFKKYLGN